MTASLGTALLCAFVAAKAPTDPKHPLLEIEGNLVLVDEIYHAIIALPPGSVADFKTADRVRERIQSFLQEGGYVLAQVSTEVRDGRIVAHVDEGRLAKIVIHGASPVTVLAMRIQLDLPHDVFNFPELERRLSALTVDRGGEYDYALVPSSSGDAPRLDPSAFIPGQAPLAPANAYELHIDVSGDRDAVAGWRVEAAIDPDSFRLGAGHTNVDTALAGDRLDIDLQVGWNFFDDLRRDAVDLRFTRALGRVRWFTPVFGPGRLRGAAIITEDMVRRQRQDLAIESYWWNRLRGTGLLSAEVAPRTTVSAGLGVEQRDLFKATTVPLDEIRSPAGITPVAPPSLHEWRPFAALTAELRFEPEEARYDRQHELELNGRYFLDDEGGGGGFMLVELEYDKVFSFGWDDLWISAAAGLVDGEFTIADTIPMTGRYLRGVFGESFYMDRAASLALEYRWSLTRDVFKIGLFHEVAVWRETLDAGTRPPLRYGDSFGPSFHALVMDVVQLDIYYAVGFASTREHDNGIVLRMRKAF